MTISTDRYSGNQSVNQEKLAEYAKAAKQGKSLKVGSTFRGIDGKIYERHIFARDTSGQLINLGQELSSASKETLQKIKDLAELTFDAHKRFSTSKLNASGKQAFIDKKGFHYIKTTAGDDSISHLVVDFSDDQNTRFEEIAYGGKLRKKNLTVCQQKILHFGKLNDASYTAIQKALQRIEDRTFVKCYQSEQAKKPHANHQALYQAALKAYIHLAKERYLTGLKPNDRAEALKILNRGRALEILKDKNLSDQEVIDAFKALNNAGQNKRTAMHSFMAMVDKIQSAWEERHGPTLDRPYRPTIDSSSTTTPAGLLPADAHGLETVAVVRKRTDARPSVTNLTAYKKNISHRKAAAEADLLEARKQLERLEKELSEYNYPSWFIDPTELDWIERERELKEKLIPNQKRAVLACQAKLARIEKLDIAPLLDEVDCLSQELKDADKEVADVNESWTKTDLIKAPLKSLGFLETRLLGSQVIDSAIEWDSEKLLRKAEKKGDNPNNQLNVALLDLQHRLETIFNWNRSDLPQQKMDAVYARLQLFNRQNPTGVQPDYSGALKKLRANQLNTEFTDSELKAMSEWAITSGLSNPTEFFDNLVAFLTSKADTQNVRPNLQHDLPPHHKRFAQMIKMQDMFDDSYELDSVPPTTQEYREAYTILTTAPYYYDLSNDRYSCSSRIDNVIRTVAATIPNMVTGAARYAAICQALSKHVRETVPNHKNIPTILNSLLNAIKSRTLNSVTWDKVTSEDIDLALAFLLSANPSFENISANALWIIKQAITQPTDFSQKTDGVELYRGIIANLKALQAEYRLSKITNDYKTQDKHVQEANCWLDKSRPGLTQGAKQDYDLAMGKWEYATKIIKRKGVEENVKMQRRELEHLIVKDKKGCKVLYTSVLDKLNRQVSADNFTSLELAALKDVIDYIDEREKDIIPARKLIILIQALKQRAEFG